MDPVEQLREAVTVIESAAAARDECRRVILCTPADADRIRRWVGQAGYDDILTVAESQYVQTGLVYLIDKAAVEAATAEAIQRMRTFWWGA
jgi:hypothetical protein